MLLRCLEHNMMMLVFDPCIETQKKKKKGTNAVSYKDKTNLPNKNKQIYIGEV